ncbi:MAG: glucose-6-phosphate dehydrogenase assembly protein OpcA [Chloroflexi bacterium]|nr:glucose-6-phosphate dehydrogenase assembly protein OpcA [Chloroflexota bacterium]
MISKEDLRATMAGRSIAVDAASIERELSAIWRAAGETPDDGQPAVVRSCVLNLVLFAETEGSANELANDVIDVMRRHPARALVLITDRSATDPIVDAWISVHCQIQRDGTKQACSEQITLAARGTAAEELHAATAALLVPNLPTALWWPGVLPFGTHYFDGLVDLVDCLIFDSARQPDLTTLDRHLVALQRETAVIDLTWLELERWRSHVAQLFDLPEHRPLLARLTQVELTYEPGVTATEPLLMAGWLASRLGWQAVGSDTPTPADNGLAAVPSLEVSLRAGDRPVSISIHPGPASGDAPGNLIRARFVAGPDASFTVTRVYAQGYATKLVAVAGARPLEQTVRFQPLGRVQLVSKALDRLAADSLYFDALQIAAHLAPPPLLAFDATK